MDMTRYEQVTSFDALRMLADGKKLYASPDYGYYVDKETGKLWSFAGDYAGEVHDRFNNVMTMNLFVKKPFDVRQAMRDKPDEWVGAFFDEDSESWRKVGFDFKNFKAVEVSIKDDVVTDFCKYGVSCALQEELDACIPLNEVPADAR